MFAVELRVLGTRSFNLTHFTLGTGHVYQGPMLFDTKKAAQADVDVEIHEGMQEDDIFVTPVTLYFDGRITDDDDLPLNKSIALQTGQTPEQVLQVVAEYLAQEAGKRRKAVEAESSSLGL
jgi:hypothetical protein